MIVVNGVKNGRASLTETISRSFERRDESQGKHRQEWPRFAPVFWRPLFSIHGSQHLLQGSCYHILWACIRLPFCVNVKTSEQSVAAAGLLYEAMGMTQSDPSHTHLQMSSNFSRFFPSFALPSPPSQCLLFSQLSPSCFVTGKVLICLFPKLFLIKDKQGIQISWELWGLFSRSFLQFFWCSWEALNGKDGAKDVRTEGWAALHFRRGGVSSVGV